MKLKSLKLEPRETLTVTLALLAVLGYVFYSFWFVPTNNKLVSARQDIEKVNSEVRQYQSLLAKQKDYTDRKKEIESQALSLADRLPHPDATPSVMQDLRELLLSHGLQISNMSLEGAETKGAAKDTKTVRVNFTASYPQIASAIKSIESSSERTYTISDVSLNKSKDGLSCTMGVKIYLTKTPIPGYGYKPLLETTGRENPF